MADELSSLSDIRTERIVGPPPKRRGRSGKEEEFESHLKRDEPADETDEHADFADRSNRPKRHRGKIIDYLA